jgi:hypothetical protein
MDLNEGFSVALNHIRQGNKPMAREVLRKILELDNRNERAWLLFSEVAEKPEHRRQCLEMVLEINPNNEVAKETLQSTKPVNHHKKGSYLICPMCGWPNSVADSSCKRCNTTLILEDQSRAIAPPAYTSEPPAIYSPPPPPEARVDSSVLFERKRTQLSEAQSEKDTTGSQGVFVSLILLCIGGFFWLARDQIALLPRILFLGVIVIVIIAYLTYAYSKRTDLENKIDILTKELNVLSAQMMLELTLCKVCKKEIARSAPSCPHCGVSLPGINLQCPNCNSTNVMLVEKGYSIAKAVTGAALLGPLGLLGGFSGATNMEYYCPSCQFRWSPK